MKIILSLIIFIFGISVGSFLNCVIYRLENKQSFLRGRSFCPKCHHILKWHDLIPILSYIFLKGKCRYCRKRISLQYPLVEIATGILFVLIFNFQFSIFNEFSIWTLRGVAFDDNNFQNLINLGYLSIISCFLILIFVYDLKHYIIPDKIIYPAIAGALIFNFQFSIFNEFSIFNFQKFFLYPLLTGTGAGGFFFLLWLVSHGKWMGLGDAKLAFFMGLSLGFPHILVSLFLAFLIGAIIGLGLVVSEKKSLKSQLPFGPFLVVGTFIGLFWGQEIINWYLSFI
ncbi:prepilin peptidase [bacterium]|nr:prepilin peptidase [bacterium]